jgi:hypothetical protein
MSKPRKSTVLFGDAIEKFDKTGIRREALVPIAPVDAAIAAKSSLKADVLGKAPGSYNANTGQWSGLGGPILTEGVTDARDRARHDKWPTPNVGVLGRYYPAIDSDAESPEAARLVKSAVVEAFEADSFARRIRGDGPRALFAFEAAFPDDEERRVRGRHVLYRIPGDPRTHKLDIIGYGNQYLIAGRHQSGDNYEWDSDASLTDMVQSGDIGLIEDADIVRFLFVFTEKLEAIGGHVIDKSGGHAPLEIRDYSDADPIMPTGLLLEGLDRLPNTEKTFPTRDDFVSALSAIRAAFGSEADEYRDDIEQWATDDDDWCPPDYFEKIWQSLDGGVRVEQSRLDRVFRQHQIFVGAIAAFSAKGVVDAADAMDAMRKHKDAARDLKKSLLDEVARRYVFGNVNTLTDDNTARVRPVCDVGQEWNALAWWLMETADIDGLTLLSELHEQDGWGRTKAGFWNFIRAMQTRYPGAFYDGVIKHPLHGYGEIISQKDAGDMARNYINMRARPELQRIANGPWRNRDDVRDIRDVNTLLDFVSRVFGPEANYELDTLAYMALAGDPTDGRPGHMLFLEGDSGVGKSFYVTLLQNMFDGDTARCNVPGTKLTNESAARFALAGVEGARIINVTEMPEGAGASRSTAGVTATLKMMVDPGPSGNYIEVERKGQDTRPVRNFARVVLTSNYKDAIQVEAQDRRIFFVHCGITLENKPDDAYYAALAEIINDPQRLAAFWRYLRKRDISGYKVSTPPPVSVAKHEALLLGNTNAYERHCQAALMALQDAGRSVFDMKELAGVMSALSENERENSKGAINDARRYDFASDGGQVKKVGRRVEMVANSLGRIRAKGTRATVYVFKSADMAADMAIAKPLEIVETLQRDRERHRLSDTHRLPVFDVPLSQGKQKGPWD